MACAIDRKWAGEVPPSTRAGRLDLSLLMGEDEAVGSLRSFAHRLSGVALVF